MSRIKWEQVLANIVHLSDNCVPHKLVAMLSKRLLFVFSLLFSFIYSQAQDRAAIDSALARFSELYNSGRYDDVYSLLSAHSQQIMSLQQLSAAMKGLNEQVGNLKQLEFNHQEGTLTYYTASFEKVNMQLLVSLSSENKLETFRFVPERSVTGAAPEVPLHPGDSIMALATPTGNIYGTLSVPTGIKKFPVILLIAGSGPVDRNGNNRTGLNTNAYAMLADSLRLAGIGCLRFDKRGVGASKSSVASEHDISFEVYVNDVVGLVQMLKADGRVTEIVVAGHSEGSLVGMLAAQKGDVKKFISIAGAGEPIDNVLTRQYNEKSPELGKQVRLMLDTLKSGGHLSHVPPNLMAVFRPSVQPYMQSWMKYDPRVEIGKLKLPVLLLQGANDLQVTLNDAALLNQASKGARLITFPKMNHVLKEAPSEKDQNYLTYSNPKLPLASGFADAIIKFVKQ